jgi:hypothetical protein
MWKIKYKENVGVQTELTKIDFFVGNKNVWNIYEKDFLDCG